MPGSVRLRRDRIEALVARLVLICASLLGAWPSPLAASWTDGPAGGSFALFFAFAWFVSAGIHLRLGWPPSGWMLVVDVVFLTLVLAASGGAENPFTLLYFLPITLSTLVSQAFTWRVFATSVLGFVTLLGLLDAGADAHAHHGTYRGHVEGMALALLVAGLLVTVFVHRLARVVDEQKREIGRLLREQERDRLATSLGAVAAGAAHELGTPLGTVQLLVEDLEAMNAEERASAVAEILSQIGRMKAVLHGLDSSELSGELLAKGQPFDLGEWVSRIARESAGDVRVSIDSDGAISQPRSVVEQIVRELLKNARRVSGDQPLELVVDVSKDDFSVRVQDRGPGLSPEQAEVALEPFVSYSGGRGLGLFLAHVHARQLGGALLVVPREGGGTSVELHLPRLPPLSPAVILSNEEGKR